jgi:hypothetical protein
MNKILGPDESAPIWYGSSSKKAEKREPEQSRAQTKNHVVVEGDIEVEIALFGFLTTVTDKTRVTLKLPAGSVVADILAALGEECGTAVLKALKDENGELNECCRIFVDGVLLKNAGSRISPEGGSAKIEMILLMANEAG